MGASPFSAETLRIRSSSGNGVVRLSYRVDDRPERDMTAPLPLDSRALSHFIVAVATVYLAGLTLARRIEIETSVPDGIFDSLEPLTASLYDVRRWRDELPSDDGPEFILTGTHEPEPLTGPLDRQGAVLLWSGGKDSTLGLLTLRNNGYRVHPLHIEADFGAAAAEGRAVDDLARLLDIDTVERATVEHSDFGDLAEAHSRNWDSFPLNNRVPFGRDALFASVALGTALARESANVSLAHDNECRNAIVKFEGRTIPRNDVENAAISVALERSIRRFVHPDLRLLPPVANLSELRILHDMFVHHPDLMAETSFCFWGQNCGRCAKCLRYYLAARLFAPGTLEFEANPLATGSCPELQDLFADRRSLFAEEVLLMMARLVESSGPLAEETQLTSFRDSILEEIRPDLNGWESHLMTTQSDPQLPEDFPPLHQSPGAFHQT